MKVGVFRVWKFPSTLSRFFRGYLLHGPWPMNKIEAYASHQLFDRILPLSTPPAFLAWLTNVANVNIVGHSPLISRHSPLFLSICEFGHETGNGINIGGMSLWAFLREFCLQLRNNDNKSSLRWWRRFVS